jgi:hypothetical protein
MSSSDTIKHYRDPTNGQYAYWNKFERLCVCGHPLGVHIAGGFECCNGDRNMEEWGGNGQPCDCEKFRPSRRKPKT